MGPKRCETQRALQARSLPAIARSKLVSAAVYTLACPVLPCDFFQHSTTHTLVSERARPAAFAVTPSSASLVTPLAPTQSAPFKT